MGSSSDWVCVDKNKQVVPSIKVKPVDTTGAGDAFIGCLLKQIADTDNFKHLVEDFDSLLSMVAMANKAGAITTTNFGAISSLPSKSQLEA